MTDDQPVPSETLYANLKGSIERLTWPADRQVAYLDDILGHLTEAEDASCYGNDELALELGDNLPILPNLIEAGLLKIEAVDILEPLDRFLDEYSGKGHPGFWVREALYNDERWDEVRKLARTALTAFER